MEGQPGPETPDTPQDDQAYAEAPTLSTPKPTSVQPAPTPPPLPRAAPSRLSWPPPRMPPPRTSLPSEREERSTESSPPPVPELQAYELQALSATPSRTPSGEIRISQIRDLLLGDVHEQYEQRLAALETQVALFQSEARTRLSVMETSVVSEIGGALSNLTTRVVSTEAAEHEEHVRLDGRISALEDIFGHRMDAIEAELRSLRSDLDATTEGIRMEVKSIAGHFAEEFRKELGQRVQQRVHEELGRIFLAVGGTLRRRSAPPGTTTADLTAVPVPPPPSSAPEPRVTDVPTQTGIQPAAIARTPAPEPADEDDGDGPAAKLQAKADFTELERWAEELSSGDIPILDPELDESGNLRR